jgi:catechol 2,3-dioxygenase-like lactoylglutathione lyase family enzyme
MIRALVPMAFVQSVPRSIEFYRLLGFRVEGEFTRDGATETTWASLVSERAEIMFAKASDPVVASQQAALFYVYCDDVAEERERLEAAGVRAGEIKYPFYAPRGEFRIEDPDGYVLMITHT